ncbi:MAG: DMT family transporter [Acidobacteriota bacterium]
MTGTRRTWWWLAAGMAVFGTGVPMAKIVSAYFPVYVGSGIRLVFAVLALLPFAAIELPRVETLTRRNWLGLSLAALVGMVGFSVFTLYALLRLSAIEGVIVMGTTPIVSSIAMALVARRRPRQAALLAAALAGLAVLVVAIRGDAVGVALMIGAAISATIYTLIADRAQPIIDRISLACIAAFVGAVLLLPLGVFQLIDRGLASPDLPQWSALVWWGPGVLAIGSVLWHRGVDRSRGHIPPLCLTIPPFSGMLVALALLGESLRWHDGVALALVYLGLIVLIRNDRSLPHRST